MEIGERFPPCERGHGLFTLCPVYVGFSFKSTESEVGSVTDYNNETENETSVSIHSFTPTLCTPVDRPDFFKVKLATLKRLNTITESLRTRESSLTIRRVVSF